MKYLTSRAHYKSGKRIEKYITMTGKHVRNTNYGTVVIWADDGKEESIRTDKIIEWDQIQSYKQPDITKSTQLDLF